MRNSFCVFLCAMRCPIVARISVAMTTPSRHTSPTVVVPFLSSFSDKVNSQTGEKQRFTLRGVFYSSAIDRSSEKELNTVHHCASGGTVLKARISAEYLKEFIGTVSALVDEAKLSVAEGEMTVKAVDPSHVAMIEARLDKAAFDSYEAAEAELGIDVDKFRSVLAVARAGDMVDLEQDSELNRLVVTIGNLTRAMPLLDTAGMPDPKVPALDLPATVKVAVEEILQGLKASKSVSDHIALSTSKKVFRLVCEGDNQNRVDLELGKKQLEKLDSPEEQTSLFSLEYFTLMVGSLAKDRILNISLGSDLPVRITADLAVDDLTGAQGEVTFLLAPRIDRE